MHTTETSLSLSVCVHFIRRFSHKVAENELQLYSSPSIDKVASISLVFAVSHLNSGNMNPLAASKCKRTARSQRSRLDGARIYLSRLAERRSFRFICAFSCCPSWVQLLRAESTDSPNTMIIISQHKSESACIQLVSVWLQFRLTANYITMPFFRSNDHLPLLILRCPAGELIPNWFSFFFVPRSRMTIVSRCRLPEKGFAVSPARRGAHFWAPPRSRRHWAPAIRLFAKLLPPSPPPPTTANTGCQSSR